MKAFSLFYTQSGFFVAHMYILQFVLLLQVERQPSLWILREGDAGLSWQRWVVCSFFKEIFSSCMIMARLTALRCAHLSVLYVKSGAARPLHRFLHNVRCSRPSMRYSFKFYKFFTTITSCSPLVSSVYGRVETLTFPSAAGLLSLLLNNGGKFIFVGGFFAYYFLKVHLHHFEK